MNKVPWIPYRFTSRTLLRSLSFQALEYFNEILEQIPLQPFACLRLAFLPSPSRLRDRSAPGFERTRLVGEVGKK